MKTLLAMLVLLAAACGGREIPDATFTITAAGPECPGAEVIATETEATCFWPCAYWFGTGPEAITVRFARADDGTWSAVPFARHDTCH